MVNFKFLFPAAFILIISIPIVIFIFRRSSGENTTFRRRISLVLRAAVLFIIILALAGLSLPEKIKQVHVIFLLDTSDSMTLETRALAGEFMRNTVKTMRPEDTAGLVLFGRDASVEMTAVHDFTFDEIHSTVESSATNITNGIYTAIAAFPETGEKRIILFSDGNENRGKSIETAGIVRRAGVSIYTVPLSSQQSENEVYIQEIKAPRVVKTGKIHNFSVIVNSLKEERAVLTFLKDGSYLGEEEVVLRPGNNNFTYTSILEDTGIHSYEVIVIPRTDTIAENNSYKTIVHASGIPSILYISEADSKSESFINALYIQNFNIDIKNPSEIPNTFSELLAYDAIIFDNIPAYDLSFSKMDLIEKYVKTGGGGFLMLGGDSSFGVGGYFETPIEKMLPVDMDVTSKIDIPSLSIVMVIDKSGSMNEPIASGETKLDLVKAAVIAAVDVLNPFYTVGLIAFDADFEWTVPITQAGERESIINDLSGLKSGGGTILFPALNEGFNKITETPAAVKHLIILSDGLAEKDNIGDLVNKIAESKTTISTIAVGDNSDRDLMDSIAMHGNGRSYFTDNIIDIPKIFAAESMIVSRNLIVEEKFLPSVNSGNEILKGINTDLLPPLSGFVLTYNKPAAVQILSTFNDNPLLSTWRYGLGRSAVFTSDLKGKWGREWLIWEDYQLFVSQLIRWIERPAANGNFGVNIVRSRGELLLTVEAVDNNNNFINLLDIKGLIMHPDNKEQEIGLLQTAPGRYEYKFDAETPGAYFITLFSETEAMTPETHGTYISYPDEFVPLEPDLALLNSLSEETNGIMLNPDADLQPDLYKPSSTASDIFRNIWLLLLIPASILFLIELFISYLILPKEIFSRIFSILKKGKKEENYTYDELSTLIKQGKRKKEMEKRDLAYWFGKTDTNKDYSARLYLAKRKNKRNRLH